MRWLSMALWILAGTAMVAAPAPAVSRPEVRSASLAPSSPAKPANEASFDRALHPDLVKKTIQKYLEGEWAGRVNAVQVTLLEPSEPLAVPSGVVELQLAHPDDGLGRRTFRVAVTVNGKPWKSIDALADVAAMIEAVAPKRFLKAEELIDADDVGTALVRVYDLKHPYVTDADDVIGKSAARPLQPDTPLRQGFLKKPFMIKKGDRVMIEAKRGGLSIQTSGITKSSGQVGHSVMVANSDSGRELRAKVVAPGLVQVDF